MDNMLKSFLLVAVAFVFCILTRRKSSFIKFFAMLLSFFGDMALAHFWIFRDKVENAFIWGVVFFAVAHIFYIIAFKLRNKGDFFNKTLKFSLILFFVSLFVLLGLFFGNGMGEILNLICVVVYGIIICACVFSVLSFAYNDKSYVSMINLIGVILFFLSDFLIGINIMGGIDFPGRGQWVWILYPLGQLMLIFDIKETS